MMRGTLKLRVWSKTLLKRPDAVKFRESQERYQILHYIKIILEDLVGNSGKWIEGMKTRARENG